MKPVKLRTRLLLVEGNEPSSELKSEVDRGVRYIQNTVEIIADL